MPGVKEAIKLLNDNGFKVIVITNQSGIGRGLMTEADLNEVHSRMLKELSEAKARIDAVYYCPHHPANGCNCRKPKTGLLERAAQDFNLDLSNSWMVGDDQKDIEAGKGVGSKTCLIIEDDGLLKAVHQIISQKGE